MSLLTGLTAPVVANRGGPGSETEARQLFVEEEERSTAAYSIRPSS
jgi:hypothetical protein